MLLTLFVIAIATGMNILAENPFLPKNSLDFAIVINRRPCFDRGTLFPEINIRSSRSSMYSVVVGSPGLEDLRGPWSCRAAELSSYLDLLDFLGTWSRFQPWSFLHPLDPLKWNSRATWTIRPYWTTWTSWGPGQGSSPWFFLHPHGSWPGLAYWIGADEIFEFIKSH